MDWLTLLMEALDDAHSGHDDDGGCDCYDRLAAAVRDGVFRFPDVAFEVPTPPVYGCEAPEAYAMRRVIEGIEERIYRSVMIDTARLAGLSEYIRPAAP